MSDFAREKAYVRRIERRFLMLRESGLYVSPRDFALLMDWLQRGVPAELVIATIEEVAARMAARSGARRIGSISYCRRAVEEAWEARRAALLGPPPATPTAPAAARAAFALEEIAEHLQKAAAGTLAAAGRLAPVSPGPEDARAAAASIPGAGVDLRTPTQTVPPVPTQPVAMQPVSTQPVATQPVATQPVAMQPVAMQPVPMQPVAMQPVAMQPVAMQPVPMQPVSMQPVSTPHVPARPDPAPPPAALFAPPPAGLSAPPREARSALSELTAGRAGAELSAGLLEVAGRLTELRQAHLSGARSDLRALEDELVALEERAVALARAALPPGELAEIVKDAEESLAAFSTKMSARARQATVRRAADGAIRRRLQIPRYSLFTLAH